MNETPRALNCAFDKVWFSAQFVSLRGSVIADVFAALNARARVAAVQSSMERLTPILMTALVTGVGLIPLWLIALNHLVPLTQYQNPLQAVRQAIVPASSHLN